MYVSRKSVLTWLMALCMIGSAVARLVIFGEKGTEVWSQIVLPVAAALLYVFIVFTRGDEMFYKTAIPAWMMAIYSGFWVSSNVESLAIEWLFWIAAAFFALIFTEILSGRWTRGVWLQLPVVAAPIAAVIYYNRAAFLAMDMEIIWPLVPDLMMLFGALLMVFATRIHPQGEYHPTWGDRIDGRKVRTLSPMAQITMYFQWERNICSNLFEESFEITHVDRYIRQKRREGYTDFGFNHVLLAAYVRGVAKFPQINRFISGQKVYSRGEDIQYCMVVKKEMSVDAPDTSIKIHLSPRDTALDVYHKLSAAVEEVKKSQALDSSLDSLIDYLNLIPGVFLKFTVWLLKLMDYFGLLPKFLLELSPFHGSLFFTSMGSLGIRPIYHHLYDFGNLPVFGAFGCKRRANELQDDGTVVQKKYIDVKFVLDERIVDGYYYAAFFKYVRSVMRHPELLDNPPEVVNQDIP